MLGELLGARYRVINVLGSGGFGHTYVAEDMQRPGNPRCVLKHLTFASEDAAMLEQVRRLFQAEAESLEKLGQHDQIPRLLAYFEENREFYLVQEFVEGRPFSEELVNGRRLTEQQVVDVLVDVLSILAYVHEQGVIHRDIKPDNLIRRYRDRKLVLIDFGAVKTIGNTIAEANDKTGLPSVPIYTSGYGASEQCLGRPRCSSDIYSLGMVGIQALTGMRPSQLPHEFNTCEVIWRDQAEVSDALATMLDRMIRYHVNERYQTALDVLHDLHQVALQDLNPDLNAALTMIPPEQTRAQRSEIVYPPSPSQQNHSQPQRSQSQQSQPRPSSQPQPSKPQSLQAPSSQAPLLRFQPTPDLSSQTQEVGISQSLASPPWMRRGTPWRWNWKLVAGGSVAAIAAATLGRGWLLNTFGLSNAVSPDAPIDAPTVTAPSVADRLSTGERLLNVWQRQPMKQAGVDHFAAERYPQAVAALEAARKANLADPETLIYLNNARIGSAKAYQIGVVVPFGSNVLQAQELLRGAAQAQDEVNRAGGFKGTKLKLTLADDDNTPDIAHQIAAAMVNTPPILGIVGHGNSDTSLAAAQVYKARRMVMISPTSSAVKLSNLDRHVFRTIPSDRMTAQALGNYMLQRLKKRKAVVFYNAASEYSKSLKQEFKEALFYNNIELVQEVDLTGPDFDADVSVQQAIAQGAEVLMLAPDNRALDRAVQVIQLNRRRLPLLAGDTVYTPNVLKLAREQAVGMVVAVPAALSPSPFQQQFRRLWGNQVAPSWRTALAYDSTQALVTALGRNPSRGGVQRALMQPGFTAPGSQGAVSFLPSGDRKGNVQLMTVTAVAGKPQGTNKGASDSYWFKPLP
jgi:eukaryotic-like serine/threonine-protein kinase